MIILLSLSLFLLSIIVLILIIKLKWNNVVSLFLIPFLLFNIGFSWYTVNELWGQARNADPEENSEIMYVGVKKPWIYILVNDKENEVILYRIPYTKKMEEEAAKMRKELKKGQKLFIKPKENKSLEQESHFEWYKWKHEQMLPKINPTDIQ